MKRVFFAFLFCVAIASSSGARADVGIGFGLGDVLRWDDRLDDIRITPGARKEIEKYLAASFKRQCSAHKRASDICQEKKPAYKSSALPERGAPLPPDILAKLGFIYPGTAYRQVGFSVYLVRLPDRKIYDLVSIWDDGWN